MVKISMSACHLPCTIKPFKHEVLWDISQLEVSDVLLGQPYMWKHHVVNESWPRSDITTLQKWLYRIPKVAPKASISLISTKQSRRSLHRLGNLSISWFALKVKIILWPQLWPLLGVSLHSRTRWTKSWKNTRTYSPHLYGYLYISKSSIQLTCFLVHLSQMGQYTSHTPRKWGNQMLDSRITLKRAYSAKIFYLWKSNHVGPT